MKSTITILVLGILCNLYIHAQDAEQANSAFFLELGTSYEILKDRSFSKLKFTGLIPYFSIGYQKTRNNYFHIQASAFYGTLAYERDFFQTDFIETQLHFKYGKPKDIGIAGQSWIGGQFKSVLHILDYDGFENGSWMSKHDLGVLLRHEFEQLTKNRFIAEFSYPIIALASRPTYIVNDEFVVANADNIPKILYSRNKLYTLHNYSEPSLELQYILGLGKVDIYLKTHYSYLYLKSTRTYFNHNFRFVLGINL